MEDIAKKRRADCCHYDMNNPPHYSNVIDADDECYSAPNAQPGRGVWNRNTCQNCRNALQRIKRKRKRQEEKAAAEEKSLIRELLIREKKRADSAPSDSATSSPCFLSDFFYFKKRTILPII